MSADNIRRLLEGWTDEEVADRSTLLATASAYEGYAQLLLAEGFCSTVFSHFNADKSIDYGTEITRTQALDSAITRFTQAIDLASANGADDIKHLALVGRARAKLDQGDLPGARADAVLVPADFEFDVTGSSISGSRQNRVWSDNGLGAGGSINSGSTVGAAYRNLNDPRVPVQNTGQTAGGTGVAIWVQTKYTDASSPIALASGDEAQLIVAEADAATDPANAIAIIDAFRTEGNEGPYAGSTTDATEITAAVMQERRRELFLEGQHLFDLIRTDAPFSPAVNAVFPGGGTYGSQRCMPLPDVEIDNNPNI